MRRRLSIVQVAATLALACSLSGGWLEASGRAAAANKVVLGSASFALPSGEGWGTARPARIFNGGDPSGLVTHIRWASWGRSTANGHGLNWIFKPGGGYYSEQVRIDLRAGRLGKCTSSGPLAYAELWVRVPSRPGGPLGPWTSWSEGKGICKRGA
jgi:hypothetical protein